MWVIDEILMLLRDGNWHDLSQIVEKSSLNELKVEMIVSFLSEYDFIDWNRKGGKARLRPLMLEFMNEIRYNSLQ